MVSRSYGKHEVPLTESGIMAVMGYTKETERRIVTGKPERLTLNEQYVLTLIGPSDFPGHSNVIVLEGKEDIQKLHELLGKLLFPGLY